MFWGSQFTTFRVKTNVCLQMTKTNCSLIESGRNKTGFLSV